MGWDKILKGIRFRKKCGLHKARILKVRNVVYVIRIYE